MTAIAMDGAPHGERISIAFRVREASSTNALGIVMREIIAQAVTMSPKKAIAIVVAAIPADTGPSPMYWAGYGFAPNWVNESILPAEEYQSNPWNGLAEKWGEILDERARLIYGRISHECGYKISTRHEAWERLGRDKEGMAIHLLYRYAAERGVWAS